MEDDLTSPTSAASEEERWASVIEPVTGNTLIDTALAQLETLTALCGLLRSDSGSGLAWIQEYSSDLIQNKIQSYIDRSNRAGIMAQTWEIRNAKDNFVSAFSEVSYRTGRIDLATYKKELDNSWGDVELGEDPEHLSEGADALIACSNAVLETLRSNGDNIAPNLALCWQSLSRGLFFLTTATTLKEVQNLPQIHLARGDVELRRFRLGQEPWNYEPAQNNGPTLLKNAQTYYRGAAALARRDGAEEEEWEGVAKQAIAAAIAGDDQLVLDVVRTGIPSGKLGNLRDDMIEDGLLDGTWDLEASISSCRKKSLESYLEHQRGW